MFKSRRTIIAAIFSLILILIEFEIFDYMFPWTGLGAIISFPLIYGIIIGIILLGMKVSWNMKIQYFFLTWTAISILNTLVVINMYPQEFRPSVTDQIKYTYEIVTNSDNVTQEDLKHYDEHDSVQHDKKVKDHRERYIAALSKFEEKIPRDGSHLLYGRQDKPVLENTDIKSQLETGQDKLIWRLMKKN